MDHKRNLYIIRDSVAQEYGPVFEAINDQVAERAFRNLIKDSPYPKDFELKCLGYLNEKCELVPAFREVDAILTSIADIKGGVDVLEVTKSK